VIAVSEFTKERILHYFDIDPDRIHVAPPAVDRNLYRPIDTIQARLIRKKYGVECKQYILSVGNLEPRKNLVSLIKAFSTLPASVLRDFSLVLIGADGWNKEELERCIHEAESCGVNIVRPNTFVADDDIPAFYSGAHGFAFVPLYEGFGMPTLEAYACGVPVLATRVPSLRERGTGESASIFVERPHDIEEIAAGLLRLVSMDAEERASKRIAMERHLSGFCWKRSALVTARAVLGESASDALRAYQEVSLDPMNAATCAMAE
jgi:alpha-1,3-rhamnosyl/mannosyltransferase